MRAAIWVTLTCSAATAVAAPPNLARARDLYEAGLAAQARGEHAAAADAFDAAYAITLGPTLLDAIGEARAMAGQCDRAVPAFEQYLALAAPDADRAERARIRIGQCQAVLAEEAALAQAAEEAALAAAAAAPPPVSREPARPWAWRATTAAVGLAAVSGVLAIQARHARGDLDDLRSLEPGGAVPTQGAAATRYAALEDRRDGYQLASYLTAGLSAASTVAAVVLFTRPSPVVVQPAEGGGATIVGRLRF